MKNFVCAFQKVATFRIVNGNKQGGNVASYFCAPDGRVLHCVAGPVNAQVMLREARWVVNSVRKAIKSSKESGTAFKAQFRRLHADRLRREHGLAVEPATFDAPVQDDNAQLKYRDPSGRPLVSILPPPPIQGPDVQFRAKAKMAAEDAMGGRVVLDRKRRRWVLGNQGRVHQLMAGHCLARIENLYGSVFQNILGERITTQPVVTLGSMKGRSRVVCLHCASKHALAEK